MRVYLCSAPDELASQRAVAERVVRDLGWGTCARGAVERGETIEDALRAVHESDMVLALVGWRRGPVPEPEAGGDGMRPWTQWEVGRAFQRGVPAVVLMASEAWPHREEGAEARAAVADLRAELAPLAVTFDPEPATATRFEKLLRAELEGRTKTYSTTLSRTLATRSRSSGPAPGRRFATPSTLASRTPGLVLREWPRPELPERPWPVLLPCSHPDLLAGRDRELAELIERLDRPLPILGLHASSGSGKSSLLLGGLLPALRAAGRAIVLDRHPGEPGIAARLVGDLLDGPRAALELDDADHQAFVARLLTARRRAGGRPPVLVLDQLEDVLRGDRGARAAVGALLAATAQRRPGVDGPLCRWLLCYRREYHGQLLHWLADPLREARALGIAGVEELPHDLASLDRFHAWPLPPLGAAPPGAADPAAFASEAFLAAISAPIALADEAGAPRYPWRFEGDGARRLARAFGEARARQPAAPLVPEMQVVLARLVDDAGEPTPGRPATLVVPDDPGGLLDDALHAHLVRALDAAFPPGDRLGRTRALLALRELADAQGRRGAARPGNELARAIGREGREVLERLQAPHCRLVVAERRGDEVVFTLSHDRLAEVVAGATARGDAGGRLAVDPELLALRRLVALRTELFQAGERKQATQVSARQAAGIRAHADTLLADDERRRWWLACEARRRLDRRRRTLASGVAVAAVALGVWAIGAGVARMEAREALLQQVEGGEPEVALAALVRGLHDPAIDAGSLVAHLRRRKAPLDVLESGTGGVPEALPDGVAVHDGVLRVAELAAPLILEAPADEARLASTLWALDFAVGQTAAVAERTDRLKERLLAPLRRLRPPPPPEAAGWVEVPAGTFLMGSSAEHPDAEEDERPAHQVTISAFRALDHEVTNAEYRRLHPEHEGEGDAPAVMVSWYAAYVYAAWLGGRLPTEAEWEYMARAGCRYERCRRDGSEAAANDVAWTLANALDSEGDAHARPVRRLAPNPWGLHDLLGNVWEWTADWYGPYSAGPRSDPWGPTRGGGRVRRGSCFTYLPGTARPALRSRDGAAFRYESMGFRPVLPAAREARR